MDFGNMRFWTKILRILLLVCIGINVFMFGVNSYLREKNDKKKEQAMTELKEGEQLVFGEWKSVEYLGGGKYEYAVAAGEARELTECDDLKEVTAIYSDHIVVDGVEVYGDVYFLYSIIPVTYTQLTLPTP